jgi:hypothetical protein
MWVHRLHPVRLCKLARAACVRCHRTKCPLLTAFFSLLGSSWFSRMYFSHRRGYRRVPTFWMGLRLSLFSWQGPSLHSCIYFDGGVGGRGRRCRHLSSRFGSCSYGKLRSGVATEARCSWVTAGLRREVDGVAGDVADGEDLVVGECELFQRGIRCWDRRQFQLATDSRTSVRSYLAGHQWQWKNSFPWYKSSINQSLFGQKLLT